MFAYKRCVPHAVLPHVEVCPEMARVALEVTEIIQREYVRVEQVRGRPSDFGGADTMLALL